MDRKVLSFLICIAVVCSGCAVKSASQQDAHEVRVSAAESRRPPTAYGPFERKHRALRPVEEAFRVVELLKRADRFTVSHLKAIVRKTQFSPMLVSGCDREVLKILVASDWAPVVVIRSPVGPKHIRAIVGYDDPTERIVLIDPVNLAQAPQARLKYSDFSRQWDDPQKTCLLVLSRDIGVNRVRMVLKKYLTEEKVKSIVIRTSGNE